jgi:DNA replication protein DnaC
MAAGSAELDSCPIGVCDGSGWTLDEDEMAHPCGCLSQRSQRAATRRLGTGIPKRFRGVSVDRKPIADLDPYLIREVRSYVRKIDDNLAAGKGLWFHGDVGTGKTSLAMLVSKAALESGHTVAVYSTTHLLAEIRHTYESDGGDSYTGLYARLANVDLLHLDDLGAEKRTDWVLEQLYSIVNARWQEERAIVATTNLADITELREQVGERTVSRLAEICGEPIPVMGADLRIKRSA